MNIANVIRAAIAAIAMLIGNETTLRSEVDDLRAQLAALQGGTGSGGGGEDPAITESATQLSNLLTENGFQVDPNAQAPGTPDGGTPPQVAPDPAPQVAGDAPIRRS